MDKASIIIAGNPAWAHKLQAQLQADFDVQVYADAIGYMNKLIETRAALVFVDGNHPDWERYTTSPKISPATRRIPVIVVVTSDEQRSTATLKGADLTVLASQVVSDATKLVADYARIATPEFLEELDCECQESLPPLAIEGIEKFNAGEYYRQHDLFEEQWVKTESPVRDLYRAILQVGIGYYQIERGNYRGALKMLQRSVQWLSILPDLCQGVDIKQLREDSYRVRAELERLGENRLAEFDHSLIKKVKVTSAED